jgi:transposase
MTRRQKDPVRPLTPDERTTLERVRRAGSERADRAARARALRAVADGASYTAAASAAGRRAGDGVAQLVARFNGEGLAALDAQHGGGPPVRSGVAERARILREVQRAPDREQDGTATWSLTTVQRALRCAPDGLPSVSTSTILTTLHEARYTFQPDRTWCHTGTATRKRKDGTRVAVTDPETTPKKS